MGLTDTHLYIKNINNKDLLYSMGFPGGSVEKNLPAMKDMWVQYLGWEDSPGKGNGNPLQYFSLEGPMERRAWRATVMGSQNRRTHLSN